MLSFFKASSKPNLCTDETARFDFVGIADVLGTDDGPTNSPSSEINDLGRFDCLFCGVST